MFRTQDLKMNSLINLTILVTGYRTKMVLFNTELFYQMQTLDIFMQFQGRKSLHYLICYFQTEVRSVFINRFRKKTSHNTWSCKASALQLKKTPSSVTEAKDQPKETQEWSEAIDTDFLLWFNYLSFGFFYTQSRDMYTVSAVLFLERQVKTKVTALGNAHTLTTLPRRVRWKYSCGVALLVAGELD